MAKYLIIFLWHVAKGVSSPVCLFVISTFCHGVEFVLKWWKQGYSMKWQSTGFFTLEPSPHQSTSVCIWISTFCHGVHCRVCSEVVKARLFYEMTVYGVLYIGAKSTSVYVGLHLDINLLPWCRICSEIAKVLEILWNDSLRNQPKGPFCYLII